MKIVRPMIVTDQLLLSSTIAPDDNPAHDAGATYAKDAMVISDNRRYRSIQNGNTGHAPATSPDWWQDMGATNRWAMFDDKISTQSSAAGTISIQLALSSRVDTVALLNVTAAEVQVVMTDAVDGEVYNRTVQLVSIAGINSWYDWCFEPIKQSRNCILTDLPPYGSTASITITISAAGNTALGCLLLGQSKEIGGTQYGVKVGIQDYSLKSRDGWGNPIVVPRDYSSTGQFTVDVDNDLIDDLHNMLAEFRSIPILYLGTDRFSSTAIYGYYRDFDITIAYFSYSICSIEIESLV